MVRSYLCLVGTVCLCVQGRKLLPTLADKSTILIGFPHSKCMEYGFLTTSIGIHPEWATNDLK